MKLPAIRGYLGDWTYFITTLTFNQINKFVKKPDELHDNKELSDMIQRSLTDNVKSIKEYILKQKEMFFNSLVLAVYDGDPQWIEVEMTFPDNEKERFYNMGFLELNGEEKIFPVDGQHRVEAIKLAIIENPKLENEKVSVVFIGHKISKSGMARSRRLFSTLNRYAKPVQKSEIIALDEDDIVAITTRFLVEETKLFSNNRIIFKKGKAIPATNTYSFTTIETLYDCNKILLEYKINKSNKALSDFLRFRRTDDEIIEFNKYCKNFWEGFFQNLTVISSYPFETTEVASGKYRNNERGGGIIFFRPIGLIPFIRTLSEIKEELNCSFKQIYDKFNDSNFYLNKNPWISILWDDQSKTMKASNNKLITLMLLVIFEKNKNDFLLEKEKGFLVKEFNKRMNSDFNYEEAILEIIK